MRDRRPPRRLAVPASLLATVLVGLGPGHARAQTTDAERKGAVVRTQASECCLVLLLPVGARTVALGGAVTARGAPEAAFANPAGLAVLTTGHVAVHHTNGFAGQATAVSWLLTPAMLGTIGISYQLFDHGEIETTDESGIPTGALALRDHMVVGSYATRVFGGLSGGLNLKLYSFRISCRGDCGAQQIAATTQALDGGIQYRPGWLPGVEVGASVTNVGLPLQVVNAPQADILPARVQVGLAVQVLEAFAEASGMALWVAVDARDRLRDPGSPETAIGVEFAAQEAVFLRVGYVPGTGVNSGVSVGLGLRHARFNLALARSFGLSTLDLQDEPVHVSLGMIF